MLARMLKRGMQLLGNLILNKAPSTITCNVFTVPQSIWSDADLNGFTRRSLQEEVQEEIADDQGI